MPRLELSAGFDLQSFSPRCSARAAPQRCRAGPHNAHGCGRTARGRAAWLEVQRDTPGCHGEVEGEIYLRGPVDSLYLPVGRPSNLVFKFCTSSLFSQTSATTRYATLIRPREGHTYEASVTYKNGSVHNRYHRDLTKCVEPEASATGPFLVHYHLRRCAPIPTSQREPGSSGDQVTSSCPPLLEVSAHAWPGRNQHIADRPSCRGNVFAMTQSLPSHSIG